jgi:hypothetical protein
MLSENTSDIVGAEPVWPASSKIISVNTDETLVTPYTSYFIKLTINTYFTWYVHFIVVIQQI